MGAPHVHVHRCRLRAATEEAQLLHRRVAVSGPQRPAVGGRRSEVPGVDIGCGVGRAQRCVSSVRQRMVHLRPLRDLADRPHCGGPWIEVAVMTGDNELGVARVRGRVMQDSVLGRRPVRLVQ